MPDDLLESFIDRFVPRGVRTLPGPYTVVRRQALAELRALVAAARDGQRRRDAARLEVRASAERDEGRYRALIDAAVELREGGGGG
jgi:hypothetical protein